MPRTQSMRRSSRGGRRGQQYPPYGNVDRRSRQRPRQRGYGAGYGYGPDVGYGYGYSGGYRSVGRYRRAQAAAGLRGAFRAARHLVSNRRKYAAGYASTLVASTAFACHLMPGGLIPATLAATAPSVWAGARRYSAKRRASTSGEALPPLTVSQRAGWAARAGIMVWLPLTAVLGFAQPLLLSYSVGSLTAMTWWARHVRQPEPDVEEEEEPERVGDEPLGPIELRWQMYLASGVLSRSYLIDVEPNDNGWTAIVQLDPGKQDTSSAISAIGKIASAYGVNRTQVTVDPVPSGRDDQGRVTVYTVNPLQQVQRFEGPTLDRETGWITIGNRADAAPALWRLFEPGSGPCGGLIFGAQGSGKSGLINTLCTEITHSGFAVLWLGDGQNGLSVPEWTEQGADWFGYNVAEVRRMLQAAERIMYARQKRRRREQWVDEEGNVHRGRSSFDPSPECPAIYVVLEEYPLLAVDPEIRRIVALLLKAGRKVGITVILVGQIPSISEFGGDGDASVARALASTTNVSMFRIAPADKSSMHMGGMGVDGVDPTAIPVAFLDGSGTQGMGYIRAPGGTVSIMRARYVPAPGEWSDTAPVVELEPKAIEDAGPAYIGRRERYEAFLEDEELEELEDASPAPRPQLAALAPVLQLPQQTQGQASIRTVALQILDGTGLILSSSQLATQIGALLGTDVTVNAVTAALKRAHQDGEVVQFPAAPGGADRSARWQSASIPRENDA